MPVFESRTDLSVSVEQLFDFLIRPANLQRIAPPDMQFVFVEPPEIIQPRCRLTCKAQMYGMIQEVNYEIVEFDAPLMFREQMVGGPLKRWLHDHIIEPQTSSNSVTLVNRIDFEPPGGMLGLLVTADKILEMLDDGFDHRRIELQKLFGKPNS